MKRLLLASFCVSLIHFSATAQTVQWASKVIEYSSQLTAVQYSAQQALGKPNVLPGGGDNPTAWTNDKPGRKEFLKLGFDKPMVIQQVAVAESWNPSALSRVLAYDEAGKEYVLNTFSPSLLPLKSRMLSITFSPTSYKVAAIKLEMDGGAVEGHFAIDAVAISDSNIKIVADFPAMAESIIAGIHVERLDANVNSDYKELNPLLTPDGKLMYFSRRNHPENVGGVSDHEDIWYSEYNEATHTWTLAKNLKEINTVEPNFLNSISSTPDGKSVVMLVGNKVIHGKKSLAGVSISTHIGNRWTTPVHLNITNEYNYSEFANYFLTNNRLAMLMSVQRIDTRGDRDLYVSFMKPDSVWTEPQNLGSIVNTVAEESAPFLAMDDKTLYFASKGFAGFGGADVYMSRRLDDSWTKWSEPINLGAKINSEFDDQYFHVTGTSAHSYYSKGVSDGNSDIFKVELPPELAPEVWVTVSGKLVDAKTDAPIGAKIVYERLPDGKDLGITQSDPEGGAFEIKLPVGYNYAIHAEASNYISESQNLDLRNYDRDLKEKVEFRLRPIEIVKIEKDAVVSLNSIFFDFGKAVLKPESFPELDRVADMIQAKPTISIDVHGHTDNVGSHHHNQKLSEQRAAAVKKYLLSKGLDASKITSKGFGETRPIVSNDDEKDGRELNRRVEFKIIAL
jgi:OmpA-OmpF porin, OOP family